LEQNEALARVRKDPDDTLDGIRKTLQVAEATEREIPYGKLVDIKLAVRSLPVSAADYWKTVAEIINYESFLNQTRNHAPNPAKVSKPCLSYTNGNGSDVSIRNNSLVGGTLLNCVVDLDTHSYENVVFQDSVVRYHGGPVSLRNVLFLNCAFRVEIAADAPPVSPERDKLLLALIEPIDQRRVRVSNQN